MFLGCLLTAVTITVSVNLQSSGSTAAKCFACLRLRKGCPCILRVFNSAAVEVEIMEGSVNKNQTF